MSAFGPKRTSLVALHMSAFGGKADMPSGAQSLSPDPLEPIRPLRVRGHRAVRPRLRGAWDHVDRALHG